MSKSSVTRDDVARLAGVAPSSVSNVINGKDNVSEKLRKKVEQAIRELNYTPNLVARSLMTGSSKHIGLIIDEITNPHFAELAKGAQCEANRNGYILSISLAGENVDAVVEDFLSRHIDGIIYDAYMGELSPHMAKKIKDSGITFVDCNGSSDYSDVLLDIDYYGGMKEAYYYLMGLGHEKIAYISGQGSNPNDIRLKAFKWCCNHLEHGLDDDYVVLGEPPFYTNFERGYQYAHELLNRNLDMTAVIVVNDYTAIGALRAFKARGVRIPDDISMVSFDNTVYAKSSNPALTSVNSPVYNIGQEAVRYIIKQQQIDKEKRQKFAHRYSMELVVRESTARRR
jgi:DNA-binding LacI/PurR family transcriptional regulator